MQIWVRATQFAEQTVQHKTLAKTQTDTDRVGC